MSFPLNRKLNYFIHIIILKFAFKTKEITLISYDNFETKTTFNPKGLNEFLLIKCKSLGKKFKECDIKLIQFTSK